MFKNETTVVMGISGVGKTTLCRKLSYMEGLYYISTDTLLMERFRNLSEEEKDNNVRIINDNAEKETDRYIQEICGGNKLSSEERERILLDFKILEVYKIKFKYKKEILNDIESWFVPGSIIDCGGDFFSFIPVEEREKVNAIFDKTKKIHLVPYNNLEKNLEFVNSRYEKMGETEDYRRKARVINSMILNAEDFERMNPCHSIYTGDLTEEQVLSKVLNLK